MGYLFSDPTLSTVPPDLYPEQPRYDASGRAVDESVIVWCGMLAELPPFERTEARRQLRRIVVEAWALEMCPVEFGRRFDALVNDLRAS